MVGSSTGLLAALASTALYGTVDVLVRRGSRHGSVGDGFALTVLFNALAFGGALAWLAAAGQVPPLNASGLLAFAGAGLATVFLGRRCLFGALALIGPARSLPFSVTSPIFSVLLAYLFLGEALSADLLTGISAVGAGLWVLSRDRIEEAVKAPAVAATQADRPAGRPPVQRPQPLWADPVSRKGVMLALLSGASFGTGHFLRKLGLFHIPSEVTGTAVGAWVAVVASWLLRAPGSPRAGGSHSVLSTGARMTSLPWEFWVGAVLTTLALFLQYAALRMMPVSTASVIFAAEPLMSLGAALFLLRDEIPSWRAVVSAVLVFGGLAIVVTR